MAALSLLRIVEALEGAPSRQGRSYLCHLRGAANQVFDYARCRLPTQPAVAPHCGGDTVSPKATFPKSVVPTVSSSSTFPLADQFKLPSASTAVPLSATSETLRKASSALNSDALPRRASASSSVNCTPSADPLHSGCGLVCAFRQHKLPHHLRG